VYDYLKLVCTQQAGSIQIRLLKITNFCIYKNENPFCFSKFSVQSNFYEYIYRKFLWHKMNSSVIRGKKVYDVLLLLSKM